MTEPFFRRADLIDAASKAGPSRFASIRQHLEHPQLQVRFFSLLADPSWLDVLVNAGFYALEDLSSEEHRLVWYRLGYLKRVASQRVELIQDIIQEFSNPHIITYLSDIAEIVMNLPPHAAASLVPKLVEAIRQAERLNESDTVGKLVIHLGNRDESEGGLKLLEALLEVLPDPTADRNEYYVPSLTPQTRLGSWEYKELLQDTMPVLLGVAPLDTFTMVCGLLEDAVRYSINNPDESIDYSTIWRFEVAPNPEEYDAGPRDSLIIAVRDAAAYLVSSAGVDVSFIIKSLEDRRRPIFRRIALHLLTTLENQKRWTPSFGQHPARS